MAGFGIVLLMLIIIRHIGACIVESMENERGKASNLGADMGYYFAGNGGLKLRNNNHSCIENRDSVKGRYVKDCVTGKMSYPEVERGIQEMRFQRDTGKRVGTTFKWKPKTCGKTVYIDYDTEQIYYLAYYYNAEIRGRKGTWFYTDFATQTRAIRKSDRQIAYEKKFEADCERYKPYDISEISADTDFYAYPSFDEKLFYVYDDERLSIGDKILGGKDLVIE